MIAFATRSAPARSPPGSSPASSSGDTRWSAHPDPGEGFGAAWARRRAGHPRPARRRCRAGNCRRRPPDAIVHQATALIGATDIKNFDQTFEPTNRLRTEGTDALLAAAGEAGVGRFVAQSFAGWPYAREGGPVKTEEDPLDPTPVPTMHKTLEAIRQLEQAATGAGGGIFSFVHLDDAADATVVPLEQGAAGVYNIVDDEPALVREWLPALAAAIGAKPPHRVPSWLARLMAGQAGVVLMTEIRGASNAKAKGEVGWMPRFPSCREGFRAAYGGASAPT